MSKRAHSRRFAWYALTREYFAGLGINDLTVESVAWVSERKDVLSAFFWLLSMLFISGMLKNSRLKVQVRSLLRIDTPVFRPWFDVQADGRDAAVRAVADGLLAPRKDWRFTIGDSRGKDKVKGTVGFVIAAVDWEKTPLFILAAASSVVTHLVQQNGGAVFKSVSLGARSANALVSYLRYTGKLFWPENLSVLSPP